MLIYNDFDDFLNDWDQPDYLNVMIKFNPDAKGADLHIYNPRKDIVQQVRINDVFVMKESREWRVKSLRLLAKDLCVNIALVEDVT